MSTKAPRARGTRTTDDAAVPAGITVVTSQLRSTNLERDVRADILGPIYVGVRAQETLGRVVAAMEDLSRTRAWSLTGPYGSGKSTLALLIDALLGPDGPRRDQADQVVEATNPDLARAIRDARAARAPSGFVGAIATARREPLVATLTRAVLNGIERRWSPRNLPRPVADAARALHAPDVRSPQLLDAVEALCATGPVLLVIDEFGKTLEYLAARGEFADVSDDLFLLQELAELGAGERGLPLFILTLQHLSFLDYASRSTALQRREWAKIQGRFEDVTYIPDLGDAVQLIGRCLDHDQVSEAGRKLIHRHAEACMQAWSDRGLDGVLPGDEQLFAALYPLHPLTVIAAPLLAAQVGQHDRTVIGFLASDEPYTVRRFLAEHASGTGREGATVRLPQLYDYFFASGRTTLLASANASRWIEIDTRLSEAHGLPDEDLQVLKTVGLLNLIDSSGALRASADMVLFALSDPVHASDEAARKQLLTRLTDLVDRGFLVYREFSDEYRVWQGSDVDLRARIDEIRERCDDHTVVKMLSKHLPAAVVAGGHSQRTGMLRHFVTSATESDTSQVEGPCVDDAADGLLIFHFGTKEDLPRVNSPLPAVAGVTDRPEIVLEAGRHLLALEELQEDKTLDSVARREISERAGQARAELAAALTEAFAPSRPGVRWYLLPTDGANTSNSSLDRLEGRSLAAIVSAACDRVYQHTPKIRNEMLGRHQLTSQGAKARRELMTAMLTHPGEKALGITGYGPERAMYEGVVAYLGLHRLAEDNADASGETLVEFQYAAPDTSSSLYPAWRALCDALTHAENETSLEEIFRLLMAPPFGIKAGVVPIVVVAALILAADEVAVFEEGTYQPRLTPDLLERLVKTPDRFSVKSVPVNKGQRKLVLDKLASALQVNASVPRASKVRNPALLAVARALLDRVRVLTPYVLRTKRLTVEAIAVREALITARDPDELVFFALPSALGLAAITADARRDERAADEYVTLLMGALHEIGAADKNLRSEVINILAKEFSLPADLPTLRRDLAARARGFADVLLEPNLKGLINLALNDTLPDEDWLDPVVVRIINTGLADWTDDHVKQFAVRTRELARSLDRVSYLYQSARLADAGQPFDAQLVTLTDPDGHESRTLVYVPHDIRDAAGALANEILEKATRELGAGGGRILLAALAQALMAPEAASDAEDTRTSHDSLKKVIS